MEILDAMIKNFEYNFIHFFLIHWCTVLFENHFTVHKEDELCTKRAVSLKLKFCPNHSVNKRNTLQKVNQEILQGSGQQYERRWDEMFDDTIIPSPPRFFIYTPTNTPTLLFK